MLGFTTVSPKGAWSSNSHLQLSFVDAYCLWRVVSLRLNIEAIPDQFVSGFRADYTRHAPGFPFFNLLQPLVNCQRGITSTHIHKHTNELLKVRTRIASRKCS
jgi:hypothetical protein